MGIIDDCIGDLTAEALGDITSTVKETVLKEAVSDIKLISKQQKTRTVDVTRGPERKTYSWNNRPQYAVFNSITDNPLLGDERSFVHIREVGSNQFTNKLLVLKIGKTYETHIYFHNNSDPSTIATKAIGIADGVTLKSNFPRCVKAGESYSINAIISSHDCDPPSIWSGVYIKTNEDCILEYQAGSATIYNNGKLNGSNIGPNWLFGKGALLGYNKFSGMLPGGNEYAGYVTYRFSVSATHKIKR